MKLIQNQSKLLLKKHKITIPYFLNNSTFTLKNRKTQHNNVVFEDENKVVDLEENGKEIINSEKPILMSINFSSLNLCRFTNLD